jgi:hypothetical protein
MRAVTGRAARRAWPTISFVGALVVVLDAHCHRGDIRKHMDKPGRLSDGQSEPQVRDRHEPRERARALRSGTTGCRSRGHGLTQGYDLVRRVATRLFPGDRERFNHPQLKTHHVSKT